jgi:histidinol-phosphate phosphatase family protein
MPDFLHEIDDNWTLFLDRDGVINKRPPGDYVKTWDAFELLPGVTDALKILAGKFKRIIIITNQQGIGKGVMTTKDLEHIHLKLKEVVAENGGRIDAVYFCPDLATTPHNCRKPDTYMAEQAKKDFPEIDFSKSIMAGDTLSDMEFGRNAGMRTVFINTNEERVHPELFDLEFPNLSLFANSLNL